MVPNTFRGLVLACLLVGAAVVVLSGCLDWGFISEGASALPAGSPGAVIARGVEDAATHFIAPELAAALGLLAGGIVGGVIQYFRDRKGNGGAGS